MKSTAEVLELTGIPREKLYYLEDCGLLKSKKTKRGSRETREWHDGDIDLIKRAWTYMSEGVRVKTAFERAKKEVEQRNAALDAAPSSSMIYTFANQKGGVGKTSLCFHLAGAFADTNKRVLVIDLDQQGNLSSALIDDIYATRGTIADLFLHDADINDLIIPTKTDGVWLIPANLDFSTVDMKMAGDKYADEILQQKLSSIIEPFDVILIDAPPSLGIATRAALNAAHDLIIPVECQKWSVIGTKHLDAAVTQIKARSNPNLRLAGYLINKYKSARTVEQQYRETLIRRHKELMFKTEIKDTVAFTEAAAVSQPITRYKKKSEESQVIVALMREMTERYLTREQEQQSSAKRVA
ncbi:MAG: ParA family protein [Deltaproteobacteria bacterium]|nr:ParA family protein [Deltaproteobacteria bacterium]